MPICFVKRMLLQSVRESQMQDLDIGDSLNLQNSEGKWMGFKIVGIFESDSEILTADLIVISEGDFKMLVKMP